MVLGFGKGPERFPATKEQTPGPGAYDPKDLETKLPPKSGFLTGERFTGTSEELEGNPERPDPSPPRERKPVNPGNDRSYSWATQKIHELNKELEAANKRVKELDKQLKERVDKTDKVKELAAVTEHRDQLQAKLHGQDKEVVHINEQLSAAKQKLAEVTAQEAKASKSAQAGAARVEQLLLELHQVADVRKQLEQKHAKLQKDAEGERLKADTALTELSALKQQLDAERVENSALRDRIASLEEQCQQQATELSEQISKRVKAESQAASAESALDATIAELQQTLGALADTKASAARSSEQAGHLLGELTAVKAEFAERGEQLGAVRSELAAAQQQKDTISSQLRAKEESMEALRAELLTQTSKVVELAYSASNLGTELEAERKCVQQRDNTIVGMKARTDELVQQLSDRETELRRFEEVMQQRDAELKAAAVREQQLAATKAQLEERLAQQTAQHDQQVEAAVALQQQLEAAQADLAAKAEAVTSARAQLDAAQAVIAQQSRELETRAAVLAGLESQVAALLAAAEDQSRSLHERSAAVTQLENELTSKEAELAQLATQLAEARSILQDRDQEVAQLMQDVAKRDATINSLQAQATELQANMVVRDNQSAVMQSEMQALQAVANGLEATLADMRTALAERDASLTRLERELSDHKAALEARDTRIEQLLAEAEGAADAAAASSELIHTLEASLSTVKAEADSRMGKILQLETDNADLQHELSTQREDCASLKADLAASRSALEDGTAREQALQDNLACTQLQLASAESDKQQLQQHMQKLDSDLAAAREAQTDLARRHEELARAEAELRSVLQEQREIHTQESTVLRETLAAHRSDLAAKVQALTLAQQEAQALRLQLQASYIASEKQNAEIAQTQADLAETSATVTELRRVIGQMEHKAAGLEADKREACTRAHADAEQASARISDLEAELSESRGAAERLGAELAQLVTDLEDREQEIKELKVARHETSSALTAVTAERADLHSQVDEMWRRDLDMQVDLAKVRARVSQLEAETQSLQALCEMAQNDARLARDETCTVSADLDKARDQIRSLQMQEIQMDSLRQELESMCSRLRDTEARKEALQNQVMSMEGQLASMTPIISKARLDDQVRALSDALERSHLRSNELEDQVRRNVLLETTAALELRRLTDENEHLVARMIKLEDDLKEQSALGHNNHKQKIQYHLRLKQELEELRHECTVLLRDKFQLEQCIRYLAVQVGMGPSDRRQSLATAERKAIEKVLPACLTYSAIYSTPLSQRAMRLSARGKNNEQGTVYAGGKETFEEGISEAQSKLISAAHNLHKDVQFVTAAALAACSPVTDGTDTAVPKAQEGATRSDTCGSPDGKASRDLGGAFGTPIATIRGAGTPASGSNSTAGAPQTLAKLEERIKQMISDVCAPATSRNPAGLNDDGTAAAEFVAPTPTITLTMPRGPAAGGMRDRDQDKSAKEGSWGGAGSNGGAKCERGPQPSMAVGGEASRAQAAPNRRLTMAPSVRTTFKP